MGFYESGEDWISDLPPLHLAVAWRGLLSWSDNAYFPGTPSSALRWDRFGEQWTLTTRTLPKTGPEFVQALVAPLGHYATEGSPDQPTHVGYINDEDPGPPIQIWSTAGAPFEFE